MDNETINRILQAGLDSNEVKFKYAENFKNICFGFLSGIF